MIRGFARVKWPAQHAGLAQTIARRVGRFLEREALLEHNAENRYLCGQAMDVGPSSVYSWHNPIIAPATRGIMLLGISRRNAGLDAIDQSATLEGR